MLNNTIKLSDETKGMLDGIQGKFGLKTYDTTVKTCALFIIRNEINLKEDYIGDYKKGLIDLENRMFAKFQIHEDKILANYSSVRKWLGGIEKDYFKPLFSKLDTFDKINTAGIENLLQADNNKKEDHNPLNSHLVSEKKTDDYLKQELKIKDEKLKDFYAKYEHQKQALFKIFNNAKVEAGGMLSNEKITINLTLDEWEELKKFV